MNRFNVMLFSLLLVSGLAAIPAFAAPEENTWQKCTDGRDNDKDDLIDGDDPDCDGVQPPAGALPSLVLTDNSGNVIGVPIWYDEGHFDAVAVAGSDRAAVARIDSINEIYGDPVYFTGAGCSGSPYIVDLSNPDGYVIYDFSGECDSGCVGTATGTLTLANTYTPGSDAVKSDFVSFAFQNSNGSFLINQNNLQDFYGTLPVSVGPSTNVVVIDGVNDNTGLHICGVAGIPGFNYCPTDYSWRVEWQPAGIVVDSGPSYTWERRTGSGGASDSQVLPVHGITGDFYVPDLAAPTASFTAQTKLSHPEGCVEDTTSFSGARPAVPFNLPYTPPVKAEVR